jgi:hypothetical protein
MKTLKDVMPREITDWEGPALKFIDVAVIKEHYSYTTRWPGQHKNVHFWVELENGKAVGWNENPATGWSFPVVKMNKV